MADEIKEDLLKVQIQVAVYSVLIVLCFVIFSQIFSYIDNRPLIKNGVEIIHAGTLSRSH